ncbi:c6 zinc finger domain-containing protein [Fusarium globosum]|uniref:C6 zinc finger domain-containing protein n=1 Tax=Fusarium globosum TaxID=78864 RepID=A0A8H5Y8V4_9HYPO|nr:c6 zinc finger domain-containing protein [Fusarium globosum]
MQIKPADFDFSLPGLDQNDFVGEMRVSATYDATTKVVLVHLIGVICELAVVLNGVLTVVDLGTASEVDQVPPSYEDTRRWSRELDRCTAKAFLGHYMLLLLTVGDWNQEDLDGLRLQTQMGMIASLRSITDNLFELQNMGLSQFLPNTL